MAHGKILNTREKEIIRKLQLENKSNRQITKLLRRSSRLVNNFFKNEKENFQTKKLGSPTEKTLRKKDELFYMLFEILC